MNGVCIYCNCRFNAPTGKNANGLNHTHTYTQWCGKQMQLLHQRAWSSFSCHFYVDILPSLVLVTCNPRSSVWRIWTKWLNRTLTFGINQWKERATSATASSLIDAPLLLTLCSEHDYTIGCWVWALFIHLCWLIVMLFFLSKVDDNINAA